MKKTILFSLVILFVGIVIPSGSAWSWFGKTAIKKAKQTTQMITWHAQIEACRSEADITFNHRMSLWDPYYRYDHDSHTGEAMDHCWDMNIQIHDALEECKDRKNRTDDVAANDQSLVDAIFDGFRRKIVDETVTLTFSFYDPQCDWPTTAHLAVYCLNGCLERISEEREFISHIENLPSPEEHFEEQLQSCQNNQDYLREELSKCDKSGDNPDDSGISAESPTLVPNVPGCDSITC